MVSRNVYPVDHTHPGDRRPDGRDNDYIICGIDKQPRASEGRDGRSDGLDSGCHGASVFEE